MIALTWWLPSAVQDTFAKVQTSSTMRLTIIRYELLFWKPGSSKGTFCDERFANLSALIDGDTDKPVAVFMHHPPFEVSVGPDPQHFESHEMMTRMADALQVSGRVIGIFCGHVHRSNLGYVGNIPATIMTAVATASALGGICWRTQIPTSLPNPPL